MDQSQARVLWGADYYPEQWPAAMLEADAQRMKAFGLDAVRMMEFAWARIEPRPGVFDFSLFDRAIEVLASHQIRVVLGTPTATFPIWLYEQDPELVQIHPSGRRRGFGTRRMGCFNSPTYLAACQQIVKTVAQHYGHHPQVIGWQVDNEVGHEGSDRCICANCRRQWPRWLENKYQQIEALNQAWGTDFWGTGYHRFHQVPTPEPPIASDHNPNLLLDYDRFCSDSAVAFVQGQVQLLRLAIAPTQWIATNLYPTPHSPVIDMEQLTRPLDLCGFDLYPIWGEMDQPLPYFFSAYTLSYVRGLKQGADFAVLEQFSGIQGHTCLGAMPAEQQAVLWTNQAIALGANKIFYFRWRTARFGQEQLCSGLLDPDNRITARFEAFQQNIRQHAQDFASFVNQPFPAEACLLYDKDNARLLKHQYLSKGLWMEIGNFMQVGYDKEMVRCYAPFAIFNINVDVQSAGSVELAHYKLISLPLYEMTDPRLVAKLQDWVAAGGQLILGWRTGTRDRRNWATDQPLPGDFAKLAGVRIRKFEALNETKVKLRMGLIPLTGEVWADVLEPTTARPWAFYVDQGKPYRGSPCATVHTFGRGRVYYLGTSPSERSLYFFYRKIFKDAGLRPKFYGMGIEVIKRRTADGRTVEVALNHRGRGKRVKGVYLGPYQMKVLTR